MKLVIVTAQTGVHLILVPCLRPRRVARTFWSSRHSPSPSHEGQTGDMARRIEGQVWLGQFREHFDAWLKSGRAEEGLLRHAAEDLRMLLLRSPADAEHVQAFALSAVFNARLAATPDTVADIARIGNEADALLTSRSAQRGTRRALLNLYIAEADLRRGRQFSGLDALELARHLIDEHAPAPPLREFVDGYHWYLEGALSELNLDTARAASAYARATTSLESLAQSSAHLANCSIAMMELLFGSSAPGTTEQNKTVFLLVADQLRIIAGLNALATVRTSASRGRAKEQEALAAKAWETLLRQGVPDEVGPLEFVPLVSALPEAKALECIRKVTDVVGNARGDGANWTAGLFSALLGKPGKAAAASRARWRRLVEQSLAQVNDPLVEAYARGRLLTGGTTKPEESAKLARAFLTALGKVGRQLGTEPDRLRIRALFDEPIAECIGWARREYAASPDDRHRTTLALLVDALRGGTRLGDVDIVADDSPAREGTARTALMFALDRFQRITHGLRAHPEALAIVMQQQPTGFLFICLTGDAPMALIDAGFEFENAAAGLAHAVRDGIARLKRRGEVTATTKVSRAARAAYTALPPALKGAIAKATTLLVVPDFRANADDIPFELFHDGNAFLGTRCVLARFASLRALTRAVEHGSRRSAAGHKRALVVAAPEVEGWPRLRNARRETDRVQAGLTKQHWDVPTVKESELSADFFVEWLPYASAVHIAAHGQLAGDEAVVLPGGNRLTTNDLLRERFPQLPVAYLNTCSLGRARYVGAGVSRGIAHSFVEAGAPAAIANLLPVEDGATLRFAVEFYKQAERHAVGEALRRTRLAVSRKLHPVLWGTTILTGDPWVRLEPRGSAPSPTETVLNDYFTLSRETKRPDDLRQVRTALAMLANRDDVRLQAAIELLRNAGGVTTLSTPRERAEWADVVRTADAIDHLPTMALSRFVRIEASRKSVTTDERAALIAEALPFFKAMAESDDDWKRVITSLYSPTTPTHTLPREIQ